MLALTTDQGWAPGIGDPTFMGWFTVLAYFTCAICGFRLAWSQIQRGGYVKNLHDLIFWGAAGVILFFLGINKQLDLQTWFTEVGRDISKSGGWYENRRMVQFYFIAGLAVLGLSAAIGFYFLTRKSLKKNWLPLLGLSFVVVFVIIRAASFHHMDQLLGKKLAGLKLNWILELTGLVMILVGAIPQILHSRFSRNNDSGVPIPTPARRLAK
jgi:hypothetical protein